MNVVHEAQSSSHKTGLKLSITIGRYSINSIYKSKAVEEEMRRVTMRFFKARKDFDYRGMKNKLKNAYIHVHRIEDVWIDCRSEHDIRKHDYFQIIVEQIREFNLTDVPNDFEDDGNILDSTYVDNKVSSAPLPLIQWL